MTGMFFINDQTVTVLFDLGASHTFISKECATRLGLCIKTMSKPYYIHSPGGQLITNQTTKQVPLQLRGKIFATHLIMLPTQKVDIILGIESEVIGIIETHGHPESIRMSYHRLLEYGVLYHVGVH